MRLKKYALCLTSSRSSPLLGMKETKIGYTVPNSVDVKEGVLLFKAHTERPRVAVRFSNHLRFSDGQPLVG